MPSDHDRSNVNSLPLAHNTARDVTRVGVEDALSAEATGEQPELGELGAEDIISDADDGGATQIMTREQAPQQAPQSVKPKVSSLDALAATISAKGRTMPPSHAPGTKAPPLPPMKKSPVVMAVIPSTMVSATTPQPSTQAASQAAPATPRISTSPVPQAPHTAPIIDLDSEDLVTRIDRTQPFDRNKIFGAPASKQNTQTQNTNERPASSSPPPAVLAPSVDPLAPPMAATQPSAAWQPAPLPRDLTPASPAPSMSTTQRQQQQPQLPTVMVAEPPVQQHRPASIAPIAIDITTPAPTPASHYIPEATRKLPAIQPAYKPPMNQTNVIAAAIAGGVALCAAAIIAIVAGTAGDSDPTPAKSASTAKNTPTVAAKPHEPREAQKGTARSAVIETPETTPSRIAAPLAARDEDGTPLSSPGALPSAPNSPHAGSGLGSTQPSEKPEKPEKPTRASRAAAKAAAAAQPAATPEPAAAPPPAVAAAPAPPPAPARPAGPAPTTGAIEVPATLMTVQVDGDYRRVQGGRIVVTCGKHRVNAGRGTQIVDVPCGGVASVM